MSRVQQPRFGDQPRQRQQRQPTGGRMSIAPVGQPDKAIVREFAPRDGRGEQQQEPRTDPEGYATGTISYEKATRHQQVEDPHESLITDNLNKLRQGRGVNRGRYAISKEQYAAEMRQLYDNHEEFEAMRGELKDNYERMDQPARAQFNELQKMSDALSRAWNDGKLNQLEYYRGQNQLYSMAQQYRWQHHFIAPGGQVGDVVDDGHLVKQRTKDGWETLAFNKDWLEQNSIIVGNKKLVPKVGGGHEEYDMSTGLEASEKKQMINDTIKEIEDRARDLESQWRKRTKTDPFGRITDLAGNEIPLEEIEKRTDPAYWQEKAQEQWKASRMMARNLIEEAYANKDEIEQTKQQQEEGRAITAEAKQHHEQRLRDKFTPRDKGGMMPMPGETEREPRQEDAVRAFQRQPRTEQEAGQILQEQMARQGPRATGEQAMQRLQADAEAESLGQSPEQQEQAMQQQAAKQAAVQQVMASRPDIDDIEAEQIVDDDIYMKANADAPGKAAFARANAEVQPPSDADAAAYQALNKKADSSMRYKIAAEHWDKNPLLKRKVLYPIPWRPGTKPKQGEVYMVPDKNGNGYKRLMWTGKVMMEMKPVAVRKREERHREVVDSARADKKSLFTGSVSGMQGILPKEGGKL